MVIIETDSLRLALVARLCRLVPIVVSGRLARWLYPNHVALREKAKFAARSSLADITLSVNFPEVHAMSFGLRGFYEWRNVVIVNTLCGKGDTLLDIGANIGTETFLFARRVGRGGHVVAFEPNPTNHEVLQSMIELNHIDNVTLHRAAVSDTRGTLRFVPPADNWTSGVGRLAEQVETPESYIEVDTYVLDEMYRDRGFGRPTMIVMDVEGSELSVLRGSRMILERFSPYLLLEVNPVLLSQRSISVADVLTFLESMRYECWTIDTWGLSRANPNQTRTANWLCFDAENGGKVQELVRKVSRRLVRAALMPLVQHINPAVVT